MQQGSSDGAGSGNRIKFIIGGIIIIAAVLYLIVSSSRANAQYFMTVDELVNKADIVEGRNVRISGAVIGDSINYNPKTLLLTFTIANLPAENKEIEAAGGLANVLHQAVNDPNRKRMKIIYIGPVPDLLRNEAQAIITGKLGNDGIFYADELLLKCPTKYEEVVPDQVEGYRHSSNM